MEKKQNVKGVQIISLIVSITLIISFVGLDSVYGEILPGNRRIEWKPGIPGGIPIRNTICANVTEPPYNARGDGVTESTSAIQNAINDCPAGQVVYLPEGVYRVSGELRINKGIVLRGDGPNRTKIKNYSSSSNSVIRISGSGSSGSTSIISGYTKDSTSLTVGSASNFNAGDFIIVTQDNDPSLVDPRGCNWCGNNNSGGQALAQIVRIDSKSGNVLTINRPLYYSLSGNFNPVIVKLTSNPVRYAGIEDLYLEFVNGGNDIIYMQYAVNCWVKNIESFLAGASHLRMRGSYACVIRDSYFHHGHSYSGGDAYGVFLFGRNSDHLIENNIFYVTRHAMVLEGGGSGNVFGYNYSKDPQGNPGDHWLFADLDTHGAHPHMNLFEGNIVAHIDEDNTWGSGSHNTFFRNWVTRMSSPPDDPNINSGLRAVDVAANNYYSNYVGNILCHTGCSSDGTEYDSDPYNGGKRVFHLGYSSDGSTGSPSDPNVRNTIIRHGNFDYATGTTKWEADIPDQNLPNSYYLSSKPAFFSDLPWPSIGSDLNPIVGTIPAEKRFNSPQPSDTIRPSPPRNPRKIIN